MTVERTRGDRTVSLNPAIGFNAVPGDVLTFSVPVVNRGILTSPETDLRVTGPDGVSSTSYVPALGSLEEQRVELDWEVPAGPTNKAYLRPNTSFQPLRPPLLSN